MVVVVMVDTVPLVVVSIAVARIATGVPDPMIFVIEIANSSSRAIIVPVGGLVIDIRLIS